uniref:RNase H type-1 domain-containing protein n=1 Tax=Daphnia galeata TaxID=27404 RepID=A0A8J2WIP6_9CRUS|nr:unnamed protein product [Daphnia galeata]
MKAIIKLLINLSISIAEARTHHNRLFSQVAQGPALHSHSYAAADNTADKAITAALTDHPDASLITPKDLGTRIDPCSGHRSTIDLIITSTSLALNATTFLGPYTGSDHLPIITTLNANQPAYITSHHHGSSTLVVLHNKLESSQSEKNGLKSTWSFLKAMVGSGNNSSPTVPPLENPNGANTQSIQEIASAFLDLFGSSTDYPDDDATLDRYISSSINLRHTNAINNDFTPVELYQAIKKLKSKAIVLDLIHNDMLKNLSANNRTHLLYLFNSLYANEFVPTTWKSAIVIPLLKPDKPAETVNSYRPISLTSCIGKLFERLITNRLSWFVEKNNIIGPEQVGFRKHRSTTDHVIVLDHDIKASFKHKKSTVAVFLDISKAYDTVWIKGLLYKLTRIGIHAKASYAPSHKSLCTLYKSLVRSRIDYGLIAYGSTSKSNLLKLEKFLYAETGTEPIPDRRDWLGIRYLLNLNQHPENLTYKTARNIFHAHKEWPPRCCPSLCVASSLIHEAKLSLFTLRPGVTDQLAIAKPPWYTLPVTTKWFPLQKKAALANPTAAQELFDNLSSLIPPTDIKIFTDGSVTRNPNNSSCAYFCPERNYTGSWRLTPGTSIFSAELQGILQALLAVYSLEPTPEHIHIFSDSRSAIKALLSPLFPKNRCLNAIRNQIECLRSSGTATSLYWIPSHCGITGNDRADKLASDEANSPTGSSIKNDLDPGELASICKKSWVNSVLSKLKRCKKPCIQIKKNLGLVPWHYSTDRPSSTCLHRLRSGHTYLNSFAHRIDDGADPSCRHGCSAIESPTHILIECQIHEPHRLNIKSFFHSEKIHLSTSTLLGLDPTINRKTQLKISNLLTSCLIKSGIRFMA